jgi:hypothetical protein
MNRVVMKSKVSRDGILHLAVPVGLADADREVQVTVEAVDVKPPMSQSEWSVWVDSLAGSWQGDFERPPQGDFEQREPLS